MMVKRPNSGLLIFKSGNGFIRFLMSGVVSMDLGNVCLMTLMEMMFEVLLSLLK